MENYLIAKATDVGVTRLINEDSMTVFDSQNGQVLAVCDGMGGQAAGDVASQLAVNIIENIITDNKFETPEEAIRRSVLAANQGILNRTVQEPELEGMGATCVMLIIKDGRVHCGWVGDSRIYYIANHTIRQISHDQSYVQHLVDSGQISPAEAAKHPQKNEITNCIGLQGMTAPETVAYPIAPEHGSVFLLCSDGLSGMVDDQQIERVVSNDKMSLQQKAEKLVAMANEAGGLDNITVEMVQFGTSQTVGATSGTLIDTPEWVNNKKKKSHKLLYSIICIVALAMLALVGVKIYTCQVDKTEAEKAKTEKNVESAKPKVKEPKTTPVAPVTHAPKVQTPRAAKPKSPIEKINSKTGKESIGKRLKNQAEQTGKKRQRETTPSSPNSEIQNVPDNFQKEKDPIPYNNLTSPKK